MKAFHEEKDFFSRLLDMLAAHFGTTTEITLHDLEHDYARTIVDIRNGEVTGRAIGGTGSNLGLEVLRNANKDGDRYAYITPLRGEKIIKSSTLFLRGDNGKIIGSVCINTDITNSLKFEGFLKEYNSGNPQTAPVEDPEIFVDEVAQLLDFLIQEGERRIGKAPQLMTRDEKIDFIRYLDSKGAFLVTKAGERIQEFLGISKFTMYNYLDMVRKETLSAEGHTLKQH